MTWCSVVENSDDTYGTIARNKVVKALYNIDNMAQGFGLGAGEAMSK